MIKRFFSFGLFLSILGCSSLSPGNFGLEENTVASKYAAGTVNIASFEPIPWHLVAEDLKPNFGVKSAKELLSEVAPVVGGDDYRASRRVSAQIEAQLSGSIVDNIQTDRSTSSTADDGTITETESIERVDETTRTTPENIEISPADLDTLIKDAQNFESKGYDPDLKYRAATALFQNITLLDKYLDNTLTGGSNAYLVRTQITVSPFAHQQPYDIYAGLGVYVKLDERDGFENIQPRNARIYPLIIADNLERVDTRRITETLTAIQASLSARSGPFSFGGGFRNALDRLRTLIGSDLNSLVTYSQPANNRVVIRLGAPFDAKSGYATRARTYDVTFVVTFDEGPLRQIFDRGSGQKYPLIEIIADTSYRHARTGQELETITPSEKNDLADRIRESWALRGCTGDNGIFSPRTGSICEQNINYFGLDQSRFGELGAFIPSKHVDQILFGSEDDADFLIYVHDNITSDPALARELERARRTVVGQKSFISINVPRAPLPPHQIASLSDDGKKTKIELTDSVDRDLRHLNAALYFTKPTPVQTTKASAGSNPSISTRISRNFESISGGPKEELPENIEGPFLVRQIRKTRRSLELEFPSLSGHNLPPSTGRSFLAISAGDYTQPSIYSTKFDRKKSDPVKRPSSFQITKFADHFSVGGGGNIPNTHATILIEPVKGVPEPDDLKTFRLTLSKGEELLKVEKLANDRTGTEPKDYKPIPAINGVEFSAERTALYRIQISNKNMPKKDLKITVQGYDDSGKKISEELADTTFSAPTPTTSSGDKTNKKQ